MAHKVLAAHSGERTVTPGQLVVTEVDLVVMADSVFYKAAERLPDDLLKVAHPERVAVLLDHAVPAPTVKAATAHKRAREHTERLGFKYFSDVGRGGIEHQIILEQRLALPGQLIACNDSHTSAAGVLNSAARGLGMADIVQLVCTGRTWYKVSPTVLFRLEGRLPYGTYGKDVFLYIAQNFGSQEGHDVEFAGDGLATLSLDDRATLSTMCTELNANFVMMPADQLILDYVSTVTDRPYTPVSSDPDAEYAAVHTVDLGQVRPSVALPDAMNGNVRSAAEVGDQRVRVDQAFVGSCANGKLSDIKIAADIVRGRRIADHVRFLVTPASQSVYLEAVKAGYVATLVEAGALVTTSTCGACSGGHMGVLGPGETCITSSTRNYRGRMGSADARIYMGSSATVAASALTGYVTDPMPYLEALSPAVAR
ncbi:aconitase/3-isopropylmalate dehydratase large subunit family protein [Actinacidiphila sp. ITFR-21]|uniref:aconitase/3-isopropylmalate dehydratase large subunit family protein n=1 Tax=Actinacidiphila sp. ITFR-21 TaxID=3075199 RepID=UPI002889D6EE|nr:aconitase/3-isopropylmalate dehydratase large subunit family protein [Streptomyces sp. ITFR-21]WNI16468.1 aconitase/3-isopropylmalate dehydratase large subunit family protein [Streptomyces sp. ITFR-21]